MNSILTSRWTKVVLFLICLVPLGILIWEAFTGGLGANPTQFMEHATGDWTLRFVAITLSITPLRKLLKQPQLIRFRRMLGLFAFFYGCCHFAIYLTFDQVFNLHGIWADIAKRRYITVGFTGFVLMIPLAITSTAGWIRRLGGKRWALLHRAIYVTAIAGVIHFWWLVKSDIHLPLEYAAVMAVLLGWRVYDYYAKPRPLVRAVSPAPKEQTSAVPD
jgi:sulfoxide reductase heme-binding subunit YedZ